MIKNVPARFIYREQYEMVLDVADYFFPFKEPRILLKIAADTSPVSKYSQVIWPQAQALKKLVST